MNKTNIYSTNEIFKKYKSVHGYHCKNIKSKMERKRIVMQVLPEIIKEITSKRRTKGNLKKINYILDMCEKRKDIVPLLIGYGFKDTLMSYLKGIKNRIFFPSETLSNPSQRTFDKYKDQQIVKIEINREPVLKFIQKFLNIITLGGYDRARRNLHYDNVFHLYCIIHLEDGTKLKLEKNEKINLEKAGSYKLERDDTFISIDKKLTLETLFKNTIKKVGAYQFYIYSGDKNNCQRFIADILESNGLMNDYLKSFILQDAKAIFEQNPSYLRAISQFSTDTAARLRELFGLGLDEIKNETKNDKHDVQNCDCYTCKYIRLKKNKYNINYDSTNGNYKYRNNMKSFGCSKKMDKNQDNFNSCIDDVEQRIILS